MKKLTFLLLTIFTGMFTGCSVSDMQQQLEDKVEEYVLQISDIEESDTYKQYVMLFEEGRLDEEGRYNELGEYEEEFFGDKNVGENPVNEEENKQVRITFAANSYLDVMYYYDADLEDPIKNNYCYLDPGESIYASQPECKNPYTNSYVFSEFRIYEYDNNGDRNRIWDMSSKNGTVLTISEEFKGTELSVEPVGEYQRRKVSFDTYMVDKNGAHKVIAGGVWKVNDKDCTEGGLELSPSEAAIIKYCYDPEEYYLVETEPSYFSDNGGVVEFPRTTAMDDISSYSVQLHTYGSAVLEGDSDGIEKISSIIINNKDCYDRYFMDNKEIGHLKVGDRVLIETTDEYRLFSTQVDINEETLDNGVYRYSFTVPESSDKIQLCISKTALEVSVAKNVGNKISFDIEADGISGRNCVYKSQSFGRDYTILEGTIGAEEAIVISAKGEMRPKEQVLRLHIVKEDSNNNETEEIAYITELPGIQTINVYKDGLLDNFSMIYKSIEIEIELVEAMVYRQEKIENAVLAIRYAEGNDELKDGDIAEASRKIEVVIKPCEGYYLSGKKVSDDGCYRNTMSFKKYSNDIAEILEAHPVKKYIQVAFDTADEYGNCVFKLDGEEIGVEGNTNKINIRDGQTITLEYTLTDSDYQIIRGSGLTDWLDDWLHPNEIKVEFEVTEEFDGSTITRKSYVELEKK